MSSLGFGYTNLNLVDEFGTGLYFFKWECHEVVRLTLNKIRRLDDRLYSNVELVENSEIPFIPTRLLKAQGHLSQLTKQRANLSDICKHIT